MTRMFLFKSLDVLASWPADLHLVFPKGAVAGLDLQGKPFLTKPLHKRILESQHCYQNIRFLSNGRGQLDTPQKHVDISADKII